MDEQLKKNFDSLCSQFEMSANAAMNVFANAVVMYRRIPFATTIDTFAQERLRLMKNGNRIDDFDLLIGCAAKSMGLTMVTHNVKHFEHIEGIHIEDWIK